MKFLVIITIDYTSINYYFDDIVDAKLFYLDAKEHYSNVSLVSYKEINI